MKTRKLLTLFFASAMTIVALTSCDPYYGPGYYPGPGGGGQGGGGNWRDHEESYYFTGQWTGDFGMYYKYMWHGYVYQFNSYDTDIVFYPNYDGASYGWGREVDWYTSGPYRGLQHQFNWKIVNGIVYLYYIDDSDLDVWIRDYNMNGEYFTGYFENSSSQFCLRKIDDYYDWGVYTTSSSVIDENTDWSPEDTGTRTATFATALSDSTMHIIDETTEKDGTIVYGNRFCK